MSEMREELTEVNRRLNRLEKGQVEEAEEEHKTNKGSDK